MQTRVIYRRWSDGLVIDEVVENEQLHRLRGDVLRCSRITRKKKTRQPRRPAPAYPDR